MSGGWPVDIEALTPTNVGTIVWRHAGRTTLTVVLKSTFSLDEGSAKPTRPDEIVLEERLSPSGSPTCDADIAPYKPRAEITFVGHAKSATPVQHLSTRLAVHAGNAFIDKPLSVVGDRPTPAAPPIPFTAMALSWDRALAEQSENPIGATQQSGRIPNVFDPQDPRAPASYAPLSRAWGTRRRFIGRGDPARASGLTPEMPPDLSWGFFLGAPQDQQINRLNGNEIIVLENLLEGRPRARTQIPGARALARVYGGNAPPGGAPIELRLDTMAIDGDRGVVSLVWRGTMSVDDAAAAQRLRILAGVELTGQQPIAFPTQPGARAPAQPAGGHAGMHGHASKPATESTMQIGKPLISVPKLHEDGAPLYEIEDEPSSVAGNSTMAIDPEVAMKMLAGRALPFGGPPPPAPPPPAPPPPAPPPPGPPALAPPAPPPPAPAMFGAPPAAPPIAASLAASPPPAGVVVRPSATFVADDDDSVGSTMAITPEAAQQLLARQAAQKPIAASGTEPPRAMHAPQAMHAPLPPQPAPLPPGFGPPPPMPVAPSPISPHAPATMPRPPNIPLPPPPPPPPPPDPDEGGGSTMILDVEQFRRR